MAADITVLLFEGGDDLVGKAIRYFTKSQYVHSAVYAYGLTFESSVWQLPNSKPWMFWRYRSGIRITYGKLGCSLELPLNANIPGGLDKALAFGFEDINGRFWYNFLLTFFDIIIYPTRKFWQKIGWVPFSSRYLGRNCSYFADSFIKAYGVDLWPDREEATTVPGDYANHPLLRS